MHKDKTKYHKGPSYNRVICRHKGPSYNRVICRYVKNLDFVKKELMTPIRQIVCLISPALLLASQIKRFLDRWSNVSSKPVYLNLYVTGITYNTNWQMNIFSGVLLKCAIQDITIPCIAQHKIVVKHTPCISYYIKKMVADNGHLIEYISNVFPQPIS